MESETDSEKPLSASSLAQAWIWTIEALASFEKVTPSLLHDVIEKAVGLPEDIRKNAGEMVALKCLEGLFGSLNYSGENGLPAHESKVVFDSSETCEGVVKLICKKTPESALRVAGPDMLKWNVKPFIAQKRASVCCSLHQLRDSILDGTHPNADFLMKKSGLKPRNKRDDISLNNEDGIELSRRHDSSSSDPYADFLMRWRAGLAYMNKRDGISLNNEDDIEPRWRHDSSSDSQGEKEEGQGNPQLLEDERRISVVNPCSSSLLPSKRSADDFTSEDEAGQLPGCDDGYNINVKKLKQHSAHSLYSGQEVDSSHQTEVLEDSPERILPQNEIDDTDHLDELLVEDKLVEEEHFGSKKFGQCSATDKLHQGESGIPCYTMPDHTQDSEMLEVINVEKVKDGSELPFEPTISNNSPAEGNLHDIITDDPEPSPAEGNLYDIITDDPENDFGNHNHVNEMNTMSHSGILSKAVATNIDVGMNADEEEKDMLSDSDGYHNERIDIAMKKKEFFSSQCMVDHDSFPLADRSEPTVCVKCNEGGQLLSCNISDCPLVVHDKCLSSSARMNHEGDFCCPFCLYSLTISEYLEAKKHVALEKKKVATFINTSFRHQSIVIKEVLQQKDLDPSRKAGVEDVAKICEDMDLETEDNQVTLDGEHVNEVVDHQSTTVADERIIELSKPLHIANSNHRESEASPLRVAPDVLSVEKDGDELADQECQGNTVTLDVDLETEDNQVTLDGEHVNEVVDHQSTTVTDERMIELSKPLHIANSNHRENEASPLRVAPDVLSGEEDGDELVGQECQVNTVAELVDQEHQGNEVAELVDQEHQGNTVAELVDQECQGNVVLEFVDQECQGKGKSVAESVDLECQGNVAELEDGQKAVEQHNIYDTLHEDQGPVESLATQEGLHYQTDDKEKKPAYAINIGEKSSNVDNDESIISRYSVGFRRKYHHSTSTYPETHQSRRKKLFWTAEEEETLREGVREFSSSVERIPKIPWKKILEFGSNLFLKDRTPVDLKDKWRSLCRSPKKD